MQRSTHLSVAAVFLTRYRCAVTNVLIPRGSQGRVNILVDTSYRVLLTTARSRDQIRNDAERILLYVDSLRQKIDRNAGCTP